MTPRDALDEITSYARAQAAYFNKSYLVGLLTHEETCEQFFAYMPYEDGVRHLLFAPAFLILATQECIPFLNVTDQPPRC